MHATGATAPRGTEYPSGAMEHAAEPVDVANVPAVQAVHSFALPMENVLIGQYEQDAPFTYVPAVGQETEQYVLHPLFADVPLAHDRHAVAFTAALPA